MTTTPKPDAGGHTAGPWRTGRDDMQSFDAITGQPFSSVYATDERAGVHLGRQQPLCIARIDGEHIGRDEEKANARLVAASPDLLAALKSLRAIIHDDLTHAQQQHHVEALNFADLVIGKAGGVE